MKKILPKYYVGDKVKWGYWCADDGRNDFTSGWAGMGTVVKVTDLSIVIITPEGDKFTKRCSNMDITVVKRAEAANAAINANRKKNLDYLRSLNVH